MPKGKKRDRKVKAGHDGCNGQVAAPGDDLEQLSPDSMSTISNGSDSRSVDFGPDVGEEGDDGGSAQDDFEEKLKDVIDGLTQKSAQGRTDCLKSLRTALSKKYIPEFVFDRKMTIQDCMERSLRKGKSSEQREAALCAALLLVQLGASVETETVVKALRPLLQTILLDNSAACQARAACADCLGLCLFVAAGELEEVSEVMKWLERVFSGSYLKGDGSVRVVSPDMAAMHTSALNAWCLLLSISPSSVVNQILNSHLSRIRELLTSVDLELRIAAGDCIAVMYELGREEDEDFEGEDMDGLCEDLRSIAKESTKSKSKKDRRQQKSSFRDIVRAVEEGDYPRLCVKFGRESVAVDSWVRRHHYNTLCHTLTCGINTHLRENDLVRDVFGLGAPIPTAARSTTHTSSRLQRHMYNAATFKARTKARSKVRDKRSIALATGPE